MSNLIHCDGPSCDQTTDPDSGTASTWLTANRGLARFDFHTAACMADWAQEQPDKTTARVTVEEPAEPEGPETHAVTGTYHPVGPVRSGPVGRRAVGFQHREPR
jgi:hypothetical protein